MSSYFIARRFLRATHSNDGKEFISFITGIATIGVALGVASLIIALTILGGFEKELKEKVIGFSSHIQVTGYQNRILPDWQMAEQTIEKKFPEVKTISPFVIKEGMVSFGDATDGVIVKGIDQTKEHGIQKYLIKGSYHLTQLQEGLYTCYIGNTLLHKLNARMGDTVLVFGLPWSKSNFEQPTVAAFVITGIYESGMSEYDDVYFFTDLSAAQKLFNVWGGISGFDLTIQNLDRARILAKNISEELGYPYYVRTIFQIYRNLFTWIELQKEPIPVILGLIIAVAAVNIIGTMLMLVLEKKKQIGILRSMGASQKKIKRIFLLQGSAIAIIGTAAGNIFAFLVCWMQLQFHFFSLPSSIYFMSSVPIYFRPENFLLVSAISILLCTMTSYIPAVLASKLDPIKAIRF